MSDQNPVPAVQSGAVDTHCHLFLSDREPRATVEAARAAGVERVICVGIDPETSRRSLQIADAIEGVFATAGMHPHDASDFDREAGRQIEELLHDPRVLGVGECGIDLFRLRSSLEDQERVFRVHIAWSNETGKPLVVHVRDAWPEVLRLLDEGSAERVVIHCFSGDAEIARECERRGYWVSFAGNVTYPKNDGFREAASVLGADRILVETDSPFLAPQKLRGTDNEPANVMLTLAEIARVRGDDVDTLTRITAANARAAFPGML
ncbi:MAG: TatD family hydrolase [Actinomycetota bacterium]